MFALATPRPLTLLSSIYPQDNEKFLKIDELKAPSTDFLKVDRSLRPEGYHCAAQAPK
jgi:hypothetical protein